jgi:UDP-N-acetylenolpyruvoylglucosamine reductase
LKITGVVQRELWRMLGERVRFKEPLSVHTSIKIGGPADVFAEIEDEKKLRALLLFCKGEGVPFLLIGSGTNIIVRDSGWRGVVARLGGKDFHRIIFQGSIVIAGGAALLADLVGEAVNRSLSGLERLGGIYGTVGGGARMNAGAYGVSFGDLVDSARVMDCNGYFRYVTCGEMGFSYRSCGVLKDAILLTVTLKLSPGNRVEIEKTLSRCLAARRAGLPDEPSAGCIFKNPGGERTAGELVERLGLNGTRCGGAAIYERHGNVIVNRGGAKAKDVIGLIDLISTRVREETGIALEPEVVVVGSE